MQTDPISAAQAYRMAVQRILKAQTLHQARQIANEALDVTFTPPTKGMLSVQSGYGHTTKQPFVVLSMANPVETANPTIQTSTDQARAIAILLMEAADAAESDGFVVEWMQGTAELTEGQASVLLNDFRTYRDTQRKRNEGT